MSRMEGVGLLLLRAREAVDAWRGFPLGGAEERWAAPGRYQPTRAEEAPLSETSALLLQHWFRPAPHELPGPQGLSRFRYWPHQRRLVETVIYLHEVRGLRSVDALWDGLEVPRNFQRADPWPKLGGQLATGSGKTKMMSLILVWAVLNALREGAGHLGLGPQALVIAPGLFVKERLLADFAPRDGASVFRADPLIPPALEGDWRLSVYGPDTAPRRLDPSEPALIVTNIQQLDRPEDPPPAWSGTGRQERLLFETPDPRRLEGESTPLLSRFRRGAGMLVINDEAHHLGDEPAHQRFEQLAQSKRAAGIEVPEEMAWIRSLRALHARAGLGLQVDLSATLYEEEGGARAARSRRGAGPRLFRHAVVDYPLGEAIVDGVVKRPVLERVRVKGADGEELDPVRANQPNAWLTYEPLLHAGIGRWQKVRDQLRSEGDPRKPILFLLCADRVEAQQVANMLTFGEASSERLESTHPVTGWTDPATGERLFVEEDAGGGLRTTVIQIHIGARENRDEAAWREIRAAINAVDHGEIPDPSGALDEHGHPRMLPNPYNVVVSVMMLKEGWDVRNVKVIVPLRSCDSRTLTEQTLGRGLRRMHPPELEEDGSSRAIREELFVMQHPSFDAILDEITDLVELRGSDEIEHPPEYMRVVPLDSPEARAERDVRLLSFLGERERARDWRGGFTPPETPRHERLTWEEDFQDRDVQTWLHDATEGQEREGQRFVLPAAPSFRDYDQAIEVAYVLPLLQDLKVSWSYKNDLKGLAKEHLERRTFRLPAGVPLSFDRALEAGPESGRIALCNLLRPEVIAHVRDRLRAPLREALEGRQTERVADILELRASALAPYPARKLHALERTRRSVFSSGAFDSEDELRFASLLDRCADVAGWLYNHRQGVGFRIPYDWQGQLAHYYPDFVVRARWSGRDHNLLVEIKGRMDERDEAKVQAGRRYVQALSRHDAEPWHFLLVHEDPKVGRRDLEFLSGLGTPTLSALLRHAEGIRGDDEAQSLGWRLLTRDGIARRVQQIVADEEEIRYTELMRLGERGEAHPDRLLVVAEGLVTAPQPRLTRAFVERRTGRVATDDEVGALLRRAREGDEAPLAAYDVVYRPAGRRP